MIAHLIHKNVVALPYVQYVVCYILDTLHTVPVENVLKNIAAKIAALTINYRRIQLPPVNIAIIANTMKPAPFSKNMEVECEDGLTDVLEIRKPIWIVNFVIEGVDLIYAPEIQGKNGSCGYQQRSGKMGKKDQWEMGYDDGQRDGETLCVKMVKAALEDAGLSELTEGLTAMKIKKVLDQAFRTKGGLR
jgi:hypothetical protein